MIKRPKFIKNTIAPNPKEYDFWVDLQEDPQGGVIKKYNVAEYKWEKIVSGTSNGGGIGESPNGNEFKDYSAQVANNLFELTKPKEYGPINHFREKIDLKRPDSPRDFGILITCENEFYVQQYENVLKNFIKEWKKDSDAYKEAVNKLRFYIAVPLNAQNTIVYRSVSNLFDSDGNDKIFSRDVESTGIDSLIQKYMVFHSVFHQKQEELDNDLYGKTSWFREIFKYAPINSRKKEVLRKSVIQTYPYANYAFRDENDYQNTQLSMFHKINDACDMYYQNGCDIIPAGTAVLNAMYDDDSEYGPNYLNSNTLSAKNAYVYCSTVLWSVLRNYIFVGLNWLNINEHNNFYTSAIIDQAYKSPYYEIVSNLKNNVIKTLPSSQLEINLKPAEQFQLRYTSEPFIPNLFEYTSTDETVAKVNKRGLITAISPGSCKIKLASIFISHGLSKDSQITPEYTIVVSNENNIESDYSNSKIFTGAPSYIFKPYNKTGVIKPTTIYITKDGEIVHSGEKINTPKDLSQITVTNLKEINNTKEFSFNQQCCTLSNIPLNFGNYNQYGSKIMLYTENNTDNLLELGFCTNVYHKKIIDDINKLNMHPEIGIQCVFFDESGNFLPLQTPVFYYDSDSAAFEKLKNYYIEHAKEYEDSPYLAFNFVLLHNEIDDDTYNRLIYINLHDDVGFS